MSVPIVYLHGFLGEPDELDSFFSDKSYLSVGINWMDFVVDKHAYSLADVAQDICKFLNAN